jgi:hypothetical protein
MSEEGWGARCFGLLQAAHPGGVDVPSFNFVWENHAPPRVQFFAWVLSKARTPSRASLLRKNILTAAEAGCPMCSAPLETVNHIFLDCVLSRPDVQRSA